MRIQGSHYMRYAANDDGTTDPTLDVPIDGTVAKAASFTSAPFFVGRARHLMVCVSCPATGAPSGTWKLQGSVDVPAAQLQEKPDASMGAARWTDLRLVDPTTGAVYAAVTNAVANATTVFYVEKDCTYRWLRLVWAKTSGSVTTTARIQFKEGEA